MLFKKLQELYKKSTPVDYHTAIISFLVIFVLFCFFVIVNTFTMKTYYNYKKKQKQNKTKITRKKVIAV